MLVGPVTAVLPRYASYAMGPDLHIKGVRIRVFKDCITVISGIRRLKRGLVVFGGRHFYLLGQHHTLPDRILDVADYAGRILILLAHGQLYSFSLTKGLRQLNFLPSSPSLYLVGRIQRGCLYLGSIGNGLLVYRLKDGSLIQEQRMTDSVRDLAFYGNTMAIATDRGCRCHELEIPHPCRVFRLALTKDWIISGGEDGKLRQYSISHGELIRTINVQSPIWSLQVWGKWIWVGSNDGHLLRFKLGGIPQRRLISTGVKAFTRQAYLSKESIHFQGRQIPWPQGYCIMGNWRHNLLLGDQHGNVHLHCQEGLDQSFNLGQPIKEFRHDLVRLADGSWWSLETKRQVGQDRTAWDKQEWSVDGEGRVWRHDKPVGQLPKCTFVTDLKVMPVDGKFVVMAVDRHGRLHLLQDGQQYYHRQITEGSLEKIISTLEEAVSPLEETVSALKEIVLPKSEIVSPKTEVVSAKSEIVSPKTEAVSATSEIVSPKTEVVSAKSEVVLPKSEMVSSYLLVGVHAGSLQIWTPQGFLINQLPLGKYASWQCRRQGEHLRVTVLAKDGQLWESLLLHRFQILHLGVSGQIKCLHGQRVGTERGEVINLAANRLLCTLHPAAIQGLTRSQVADAQWGMGNHGHSQRETGCCLMAMAENQRGELALGYADGTIEVVGGAKFRPFACVLSLTFFQEALMAGGTNGQLWRLPPSLPAANAQTRTIQLHQAGINAMAGSVHGLLTGGDDGLVCLLDSNLQLKYQHSHWAAIVGVAWHNDSYLAVSSDQLIRQWRGGKLLMTRHTAVRHATAMQIRHGILTIVGNGIETIRL